MIPKYKLLKQEIDIMNQKITDLEAEMRRICPHKKIVTYSSVNDDWAYHKTYYTSYKCLECGLFSSYDEDSKEPKSKLYLKMQQMYDRNKYLNKTQV